MRKIQKILLGSFLTGVLICGVGAGTAIGEYSSLTYLGERTLGEEKLVTENFDYTFDPELGAIRLHPSWYGGRETAEVQTDDSVPENVIRYEITYLPETIEPELIFRPGKAEEIFSEEIVTGESETEAAEAEAAVIEEVVAEESEAEAAVTEETVTEESEAEAAVTEETVTEESETETAETEEVEAGESETEAAATEESETETAETEESETEETVAKEEETGEEKESSEILKPQIQGDLLLETWYQGDMGIWMEAKDQILADLKDGKIAGYQVPHIKEITIKVNPATEPYVIFDFQE